MFPLNSYPFQIQTICDSDFYQIKVYDQIVNEFPWTGSDVNRFIGVCLTYGLSMNGSDMIIWRYMYFESMCIYRISKQPHKNTVAALCNAHASKAPIHNLTLSFINYYYVISR